MRKMMQVLIFIHNQPSDKKLDEAITLASKKVGTPFTPTFAPLQQDGTSFQLTIYNDIS